MSETTPELIALQRVLSGGATTLDLDAVLGRCLEQTLALARADAGLIYLLDGARARYHKAIARSGDERLAPPTLPAGEVDAGIPGELRLLDMSDERVYTHELHARARAVGLSHAALLTLRADERRVGFVALMFRTAPQLSDSTWRTLTAIAAFEAVSIENARAHRQLELRARLAHALRDFGERALDPEADVPTLILETACQVTRSDRALMSSIIEKGQGELWSRVEHAVGKDRDLIGFELPASVPFLREALARAEPTIVEETSILDPDSVLARVAREHETASFILLPMRLKGKPVGFLFAGSGEPREYSEAEPEALSLLATMAAQALERHRRQDDLHAQKTRLQAILEHLPIVVAVVDRSGAIVHLNAAGRKFQDRMSSYNSDWRDGIRDFEIFDREGKPIPFEESLIVQAFRGATPAPREQIMVKGGKRMAVMAVAAPLPSPDGSIDSVVTAFHDVTALRELADTKDRFLSIASHELRSPITSLRATTSLLQLDPSALHDDERRAVLLGRIQRQVDRLATLVERLLDTTRLNAGELPLERVDCDLVALSRDAVEHARLTDREHTYRVDGVGSLPGRWDPGRIEQVLTNLIGNAARYSPSGTEIVVRLRRAADPEGDRAIVDVIDRGVGIAPEQQLRLFTPFFRGAAASRYKGGIGLGLYITREIVRRHAGEVRVISAPGSGSTFTVELPLSTK
jgi:signal transduction histidine kinase/GAF domain-containing protein